MRFSSQIVFVSLLASSQLVQGFQPGVEARDLEKKYVGSPSTLASRWVQLLSSVEARHHTEAQIAAKEAKAAKSAKNGKRERDHTEAQIAAKEHAAKGKANNTTTTHHHKGAKDKGAGNTTVTATNTTTTHHHKGAKAKNAGNDKREPQEADGFGPWDTTEDEFGSWVDKRDPHHTEAQIAAKKAAAAKKKGNNDKREAHHTEAQIAAKKAAAAKKGANSRREPEPEEADEFGPWDTTEDEFGSWVDKREAHHTEAQIAAKEAAAAKKNANHNKREAHHTEAQIAAKKAAAAKKAGHNNKREASPQEADEFGPWDTTEDEFGSWVDKRDPHHTEAQIAAKKAAAAKKAGHNKREASPQEADEFGPWDTTEDEFGSWVDKREAHHTEAQIAAKEAAAKKKGINA